VGKDLLDPDYDAIRKRLRQHAITEKLQYQARRLKTLIDQEPAWIEDFCQSVANEALPAAQVDRFPLLSAYSLIQWVLEVKIQVFDQLRGAMRIAEVGGSAGLNSGSDPLARGSILEGGSGVPSPDYRARRLLVLWPLEGHDRSDR
jgi:hypothetical protein